MGDYRVFIILLEFPPVHYRPNVGEDPSDISNIGQRITTPKISHPEESERGQVGAWSVHLTQSRYEKCN